MPRLLQRGFLAAPSDEAERTWLHRGGTVAKLVGISDIGVENWFYSRASADGQPTLDDAITEYECDLSKRMQVLRKTAPGTTIPANHAAETVMHLVLRSAHLRRLMSSGLSRLRGEIEALFTNPMRFGETIGLAGPTMSELTLKAIRDGAAELVPAGIPSTFSERLMTFFLREAGDQLVAQAAAMLGPLVCKIFGDIAAEVREAHNRTLNLPIENNGWVGALGNFAWMIERAEDLILPDAVALSRAPGGQLVPLLFNSGDEAELVVMPVASDRILVGRRDGAVLHLDTFNEGAAAASENFFIAARSFDKEALATRIGTCPAEMLRAAISETIHDATQARQLVECSIPPAQPEERVQQNFSYTLQLVGFGDAVLAKELADIVQVIIARFARSLPLHDLDSITATVDYVGTLATLDRGDPTLPPIMSGALGYGQGVAMPVTVLRDGKAKTHLVVKAEIAEAWISTDPEIQRFGLYILVNMLAKIAHSTRYANAHGIGFAFDPMARELHGAVAETPSRYWTAREAAFVSPDQGAIYADLVIDSLDYAEREIAAKRMRMADPSDIHGTIMCALACVSAVLNHVADWLGHRDGLPEDQLFAGSDLPQRLNRRGLDHWIELFGRDLAACYGPEGALEFSVVVTLSRHVERLFWNLGLWCWPEGEGMRCIIVGRRPFSRL